MRIVLLLVVLAAIGFSATRALKTPVADEPAATTPQALEPLGPVPAARKFEQEVNDLLEDAAAEGALKLEEVTR